MQGIKESKHDFMDISQNLLREYPVADVTKLILFARVTDG